jgi:periplasmic divalent cation tolerance protein
MKIELVYITAGDKDEAKLIGKALMESRLAACVNIIDHMNSLYYWEGELQDDQEVILIAKTTSDKVHAVTEKVKSIHSYDCPCVLSLPVTNGNDGFTKWIEEQVA